MSEFSDYNDPKVLELLKALGRAYLENGENQKAAEKFRHLIQQGHEDAEITRDYALALARTEAASEDALAAYSKAIELDPDNKSLCLTLAAVFLKTEVLADPALKVYRRALDFAPPFQDEIKAALEKIFEETTETVAIPEIRETLLECVDNPQLLSIFLNAVWHDKKYAEALEILTELYSRSSKDPIYLKGICETLLMQKANAEQIGQQFTLSNRQADYCLQYANLSTPLERIADIETYLDYKNLFISLAPENKGDATQDEYEVFLLNKAVNEFQEPVTNSEIKPGFHLGQDLVGVIGEGPTEAYANFRDSMTIQETKDSWARADTIAIFHITNYDASPEASKLPFETFVRLVSRDLAAVAEYTVLHCNDGIVVFSTDARSMFDAAVNTLSKLARYNQVVEETELIALRVALHCSPIAFRQLENEGISEIRKAFKVGSLTSDEKRPDSQHDQLESALYISDEAAGNLSGIRIRPAGEHVLRFLPGKHAIYRWQDEVVQRQDDPTTKRFLGKYEVLETLREHPAWSTFRAYDSQLDRTVILKTFNTDVFARLKSISAIRKQFFEEIRKLNRISHPGINVIYDAGEDGDCLFLVREVVEGQSLKDFLATQTDNPGRSALELYVKVCRILSHCHEQHIWHKNLKPSNIFVIQQRDIKILDAGILKLGYPDGIWDGDATAVLYAAPEQLDGIRLTPACDIFQLGVMLYESLAGRHPFEAETAEQIRSRIATGEPDLPLHLEKGFSEAVSAVLKKALHKHPEERQPSLQDLEVDLKRALDMLPAASPVPAFDLLQ